jgi:hypothetical protein
LKCAPNSEGSGDRSLPYSAFSNEKSQLWHERIVRLSRINAGGSDTSTATAPRVF